MRESCQRLTHTNLVRACVQTPQITPADQAAAHALLLDHLAGDSAPDAYDVLDRDPAVEAAAAKAAAAAAGDDADGDESGAHGLTVQWKRQGDNSRYEGKLRSGVKRVEPLLAGIGSAALGSKAPLHAVVGGSMGGMQCLQFVSQFADRVKLAVSIASTPVTRCVSCFPSLAMRAWLAVG